MSQPIDDLYDLVLPVLARNGIEDTTENRLAALTECRGVWKAGELTLEQMPYMAALDAEIFKLRLKIKFPSVFESLGL